MAQEVDYRKLPRCRTKTVGEFKIGSSPKPVRVRLVRPNKRPPYFIFKERYVREEFKLTVADLWNYARQTGSEQGTFAGFLVARGGSK